MKRLLVKEGIKSEIGVFGGVRALVRALVGALLLPTLNSLTRPWPTSSSCSPVRLAGELRQRLRQV